MPIYEYECTSCGHRFEKMVRIGASTPPCPSCEAIEVRKLISASGFILKGGGWYKDHYGLKSSENKSEGGKSEGGKSEGGKSEGSKSEGGKSEGKSASSDSGSSTTGSASAGSSTSTSSSGSSGGSTPAATATK